MSAPFPATVAAADGCAFATDVALPPDVDGGAPAVVVRTPYGRQVRLAAYRPLVDAGFAVVAQDLRGCGGSSGSFTDGADEAGDGRDTLRWVAAQPWSDGRVVCAGEGYEANAAWQAAASGHPSVAAVVSQQPWIPTATGGPFLLEDLLRWRSDLLDGGPGSFARLAGGLRPTVLAGPLAALGERWPAALGPWPPSPPERANDMVEAARRVGAAGIPSLHLASWFCSSAATSLVQAAIATGGGGAVTTVAGPWVSELTHRLAPFCALAIDDDIVPDPAGLAALWLERVLEGRGPGLAPRTFLLGSHRWTDVDPVTGVKPGPAAVWIAGPCGRLSQSGPPVGMAELVHDPADPFPSGRHSDDHRPLIARADVLHWATPSLRRPLAWFGAARCHLVVEAPAPGCDVVVTLLYDQLDGSRVRLADAAVEVAPGRIEVDVALPPVAVEVPAGSRLHVEVTAARFPRFARSLPGADRWSAASAAPLTLRVGPGAGGLLHLPTVAWPPAPAVAVDEAEAEDGRPMARLVDDRTGVVTSVRPVPTAAGAPPWLHLHAAAVADIGAHLPWPADRISTGMSVGDPERAWVCAVGEAVERYCGNLVPAGLVRSSYGRLAERGIAAVDPGALALYSPAQYAAPGFPFQPFTADLQVRWVDGRSLCDGAPILVPASLVYVNYHVGPGANEPVTNFVNLAGIAAGPDRRSAEASAMEELIERDATIIWWYNGLPARPVEIDHPRLASMLSPLPEAGPGWGRAAGTDSGWRYRVVALPTTLDVAVMGVLVHDPDLAIFGFGVAARPDPAEAVRKAFAEAVSLHLYANGLLDPDGDIWQLVRSGTIDGAVLKPHRPDRQYLDDYRDDWRDVVDLACHSQVWLDPRLHHALGPIVDDAPVVTLDDLPHLAGDTWTAYRDRLVGRGLQPYSVDVTTPDVAAAGAGAVRVVAPGAYSNPPAAFPLLGGHRLYQDPVVLGLRSAPLAEGGIRRVPLPHT